MRFYTKEKEGILNYYNSNQHRSCNTRSDQGSFRPHIQFVRAAAFLSTSCFLHFDCLIPDCFCFITSCPSQPFDFIFFSLLHSFPQRAQHLCGINKLSAFSKKKCNERSKYENAIYTQTLPTRFSQRLWQCTLHYSWTLARHSEKQYKSQVLQNYGLPSWICNVIG